MNKIPEVAKFTGIEAAPDLSRTYILSLYLQTIFIGMLVVMPPIQQSAFLKGVIKNSPDLFSLTSGFEPDRSAGIGCVCWLPGAWFMIAGIRVTLEKQQIITC